VDIIIKFEFRRENPLRNAKKKRKERILSNVREKGGKRGQEPGLCLGKENSSSPEGGSPLGQMFRRRKE